MPLEREWTCTIQCVKHGINITLIQVAFFLDPFWPFMMGCCGHKPEWKEKMRDEKV